MKNHSPKIYLVDIDGTLCKETCYTPEECLKATPIKEMVDKVNKVYLQGLVIIYTARREHLIPSTIKWLRKNEIDYHAISNHKIPGDLYIDNKAFKPEDFKI